VDSVAGPVLETGLMVALRAGEIISRIKSNLGVSWRDSTYRDTFKFGGPDTEVTGIATTAFCSLDVVQRASSAGLNMIIPHEVTFWNDRDDISSLADHPIYKAKTDFMRTHNIVVFRMHDHMHVQRPDFTFVGSARSLGLDKQYETDPQSHRYTIPETTLGALAADLQKRLGAKAFRVVGDATAKVSRLQLGVGYSGVRVDTADVDVLISGESQEADGTLDNAEYVLDAAALGRAKGWIILGHTVSEEQGMQEMAQWMKSFTPEIPVQLVRAGEPFWTPE
jgi:putative NIF3 family GTP cyclohydrolase 1 type 2